MRIILFIFLLLPIFAKAQVSDFAVSDSIWYTLDTLGYDSLIQVTDSFYDTDSVTVYTAVFQMSGASFKAVSDTQKPQIFAFANSDLTKCWALREMSNWIEGTTGTNLGSIDIIDFGGGRKCTITVSGDTWEGQALDDTNALARAWFQFLIDPDFLTYIQ